MVSIIILMSCYNLSNCYNNYDDDDVQHMRDKEMYFGKSYDEKRCETRKHELETTFG